MSELSRHLIPRRKLFGNPSRSAARLSPDGQQLTWLAPRDGVMNVWLAPVDDPDAAIPITASSRRPIQLHLWSRDGSTVLFLQDRDGDENWHVCAVDIKDGIERNLTPFEGVRAALEGLSWTQPHLLAVGLNDRDPAWHDLYHLDIHTGARTLVFENTRQVGARLLDADLNLCLAESPLPSRGRIVYRATGEQFEELMRIGHEDDLATYFSHLSADRRTLYHVSCVGRDRAALFAMDWPSGGSTVVAEHPRADIGQLIIHPVSRVLQGYGVHYLKPEWHAIGEAIADDLTALTAALGNGFSITSRTKADDRWIVARSDPRHPADCYLWDRSDRTLTHLFSGRPELATEPLVSMHPVVIPARDELDLVCYLSLPATEADDRPAAPLPMVLNVHGGPWARDGYGYDPEHQWLANRGYAVLSVNFRGSVGFGKGFINAGDLQWGRAMHDDLIDAVEWAVREGIAQRDKVAIYGGSYGGYAALAGLTFTPDAFACGIDVVGPSNLETLLATVPPYWAAFFENLARRVGDPRTEEGRALLKDRSPLNAADRIARPLLIGQGANDPRVKQAESDQIVSAMQANGLPVTYVLYPDEGHGFAVPENRLSFYAITEAFLAAHLGGAAEPIGADLNGAKLEVPAGATAVAGLQAALQHLA